MPQPRVLISGASIAGPALAYWLVRAGCKVTIVERASLLRSAGQGVDVRDCARDVIRRMGIFDKCRERSSKEEGIKVVDGKNRDIASFGVDLESGKGDSFTSDIEILRGELAGILFDETKDDVEYIFDDYIDSLQESESEVNVSFKNGTPKTTYDLVVGADGLGSRTRRLALGADAADIKSLNAYVSYFSIPKGETDSMYARCHWTTGGRNMTVRPDNVGKTRVFLSVVAYDGSDKRLARFAKVAKEGVEAQKALVRELFQDAGWEIDRMLEGMHKSDDFYQQHVAQVRVDRWSKGRVALVGDAGYAPSPFTGMGTSLAFIGAYILAGEISKQPKNIPAALESYDEILRPYVQGVQKLPPGIPWIINPQTAWGLRLLETFARCAGWAAGTWVATLISKLDPYWPSKENKFKLPEYEAFR